MFSKRVYGIFMTVVLLLMLIIVPASANIQTETPLSEFRGAPLPDSVIISELELNSVNPAVAYNSKQDHYLVIWSNDRPGNDDIQAQRIDKNGQLLGGNYYIAAGPGHDRRYPDVAYDPINDQYLVVWQNYDNASMVPGYGIHAKLVPGSGGVADPSSATDIIIQSKGGNLYTPGKPAVAYGSTDKKFLVVWSETWHPSPLQKDILGQMIAANGSLHGAQITISNDPGTGDYREAPDVAYNRFINRFLVVFEQRYSNYPVWGISGQQVSGPGVLHGSNFQIHYETSSGLTPKVAASPTSAGEISFLVTFKLLYSTTSHIRYNVIKNDGSVENKGYVTATPDEKNPAVAANEKYNEYLVIWTQPNLVGSATWDSIFGQNISSDGNKFGQKSYIWGIKSMTSDVAAGHDGKYLVVYDDNWLPNSYISGTMWVSGNFIYLPLILR